MRRSRSPATSPPISRNWPASSDDAPDREPKLREFCRRFAERAFRRPLDGRAEGVLHRSPVQGCAATWRRPSSGSCFLVLKSPRFLYREIGSGRPDGYDVASRLSFGLWDSLPDQPLLDAAAAGQLGTPRTGGRARPSGWSPTSAPARSSASSFSNGSRSIRFPTSPRIPSGIPQFDEAVVSDLRTSLDLFLEDVIGSEAADFRQLLRANYVYLNGRLAQFYGADLSAGRAVPEGLIWNRASGPGVLTHPYLMASFAYTATSSPIHRGVFIARSVLGRVLRPPPEAVAPLAADLHPDLTTRAARDASDQARVVPVVPRDDQSPRIYPGAFRRRRSIPKRGERAGRSTRPAPTRPARARR